MPDLGDTLEPDLPPTAGLVASPRESRPAARAPNVDSADRTSTGLRRCSSIIEGGVGTIGGRCPEPVVIPTDFCKSHGGYAARAKILSRRNYAEMMKGSESLRSLFQSFYADPELTDIRAELALQRTMLAAFLDRVSGPDGMDLAKLANPDVISAITALNREVAKLAEQAAQAELRVPTSVSVSQIIWVVKQVCDGVESALMHELEVGRVEVSEEAHDFDGGDGAEIDEADGKRYRPVDLVRRRIMARVADHMEALVVPSNGVETKKTFERSKS